MFHARAFENARPDGIGVLEISPVPEQGETAPRRFVPLQRTTLRGEVVGPLAALQLTHVYRFSRKDCDRVLEAVYRFPLPGDAAVTGVRVCFGSVEIRAELKERQRAEQDYEEAKQQGRQAALLTRESPDVFTLQVAGIAPDQDVTVETDYVQQARAEGDGWSLRVPLTTAPRYVRDDEAGSRHAAGQPLALLRDPGHRFVLDLVVAGAGSVESPTHHLAEAREEGGIRLRLRDGEVVPDRDCVLVWRPAREEARPGLQVFLHEEPAAGDVYFIALVAPPHRVPRDVPPRETILLVDRSGSMQGAKWQAADWAVKKYLAELGERDVFALGLFHDSTHWLSKGVQKATSKTVQEAVAFLEKHKDSGGTQLGVALEQALDRPRFQGDAGRHVLIITDAEVSDAGRILRLADDESRRPDRRRIDVLCIDAAPNSFLAHELAERGGGIARFLTSAPEELDVATALDEVLADLAQPVLTGLGLEVNRPQVQAAGRTLTAGCIDLGDLPAGRCVWVAGRVPRGDDHLTFRLRAGGRTLHEAQAALSSDRNTRPALKALFGARRVLGLEYLINAGYPLSELGEQLTRLGYDPETVLADQPAKAKKVYAENERAGVQAALRRLLVREALTYGLASAETAFVAARAENGQPVEGTVVVANALPAGWSEAFLTRGGMGSTLLCAMAAPPAAPPPGDFTWSARAAGLERSGAPDALHSLAPLTLGGGVLKKAARAFSGVVSKSASLTESAPSLSGDRISIYLGVPRFEGNEALLFDSGRPEDAKRLPGNGATFVRLQVTLAGGASATNALLPDLSVLLFVEDLASPRARVRLSDLLRQGGDRPLNLRWRPGQAVRVLLSGDPGKEVLPALAVTLYCS